MKKFSLSLLALAAMAFTACTNEDVVLTDDATNTINAGGDGYVALTINLPTQPTTRAASNANDTYKDGTSAEYNVNDVTLLLFNLTEGTDEGDATFYAAYNISSDWTNSSTADQNVTRYSTVTQKIDRTYSGDLYALVVLNKNGVLTLSGTGTDATGYYGDVALTSSTTFSQLQETASTFDIGVIASTSGNGNFYMSNAPLFSKAGGSSNPMDTDNEGSVSTLVKIDSQKIYTSADEAAESPAASIYVERGVAKITVRESGTLNNAEDLENVEIKGFVIDQENLTEYPVRNAPTDSIWWGYKSAANTSDYSSYTESVGYRFVGGNTVGDNLYRTYWAVDNNYSATPYTKGEDGTRTYTNMTYLTGQTPTGDDLNALSSTTDAPVYCLENTFNVDHMNKSETTRLVIAASLNGGTAFYVIDDNNTIVTEDEVKADIKEELKAVSEIHNALANYTGTADEFVNTIGITFGSTESSCDDLSFTLSFDDFTADKFTDVDNGTSATLEELKESSTLESTINNAIKISYYASGLAYYPVLIEHFGGDLTPWGVKVFTNSENGESYPDAAFDTNDTAEQDWLGRYGVLRNNWYDITITGVQKVGYPTIPDTPEESDDPVDSYIAVKINVLSWAYRSQEVTL